MKVTVICTEVKEHRRPSGSLSFNGEIHHAKLSETINKLNESVVIHDIKTISIPGIGKSSPEIATYIYYKEIK